MSRRVPCELVSQVADGVVGERNEGDGFAGLEQALGCSCKQALFALFQYYCSYGHDKRVLEDREQLKLYEFEKFMKLVGIMDNQQVGIGDVVVVFERFSSHVNKTVDFRGFVAASVELSFLRFYCQWLEKETKVDRAGICQEALVWCFKLFIEKHIVGSDAWRLASSEREDRCRSIETIPYHVVAKESKLIETIFRYYTWSSNRRMDFECFLVFTREFDLHPSLCSRRSVARCFRSAFVVQGVESAVGNILTEDMFAPCLVILAQEIFNHHYVNDSLRNAEASFLKLLDFLRSCKNHMYKIETVMKGRIKILAEERRRERKKKENANPPPPPPPPPPQMVRKYPHTQSAMNSMELFMARQELAREKRRSIGTCDLSRGPSQEKIKKSPHHRVIIHRDGTIDINKTHKTIK